MGGFSTRLATRLALGGSILALASYPMIAAAQDTASTIQDQPTNTTALPAQGTGASDAADAGGDIVVTGIRA
ncbi:hypothetical protein AB0086_26550, partial [Klebsiella pneumoniae]